MNRLGSRLLLALGVCMMLANRSLDRAWQEIGELPDGTGGDHQPANLGVGGAQVGTHNGALIIAGGSNFPVARGEDLWSDRTVKIFYDKIWVATGFDQTASNAGHSGGRHLEWQAIPQTLPSKLGYGATASNGLGMFLIGGTDGRDSSNEAWLLRWNAEKKQLTRYRLPSLPVPTVEGAAAIMDGTLYVMVGSNGRNETADLYGLDLSRIDPDQFKSSRQSGAEVLMSAGGKTHDEGIGPWRKLAAIPDVAGHSMARSKMMLAGQSDGRRMRLFVIGGQRVVSAREYPDAAPAGLSGDLSLIHYFNDVWAFTPRGKDGRGSWALRGEIGGPDGALGRAAGSAVAIGRSKILVAASATDQMLRLAYGPNGSGWARFDKHPGFDPQSLIYDARTGHWQAGPRAPMIADPLDGAGHRIAAAAVTTSAICIDGKVVLPTGEVRPRVRSPLIWSIEIPDKESTCRVPR